MKYHFTSQSSHSNVCSHPDLANQICFLTLSQPTKCPISPFGLTPSLPRTHFPRQSSAAHAAFVGLTWASVLVYVALPVEPAMRDKAKHHCNTSH